MVQDSLTGCGSGLCAPGNVCRRVSGSAPALRVSVVEVGGVRSTKRPSLREGIAH